MSADTGYTFIVGSLEKGRCDYDHLLPWIRQYLEKLWRIRERAIREISDPVEREKRLKELGSPEALAKLLSKRPGGRKGSGK